MKTRIIVAIIIVAGLLLGFAATGSARTWHRHDYDQSHFHGPGIPRVTIIDHMTSTTSKPATTTSTTVKPSTTTTTAATGQWKLEYDQQFNSNAAAGQFLNTYKDFTAYPTGWSDTSKNGRYRTDNLSVSNGALLIHCGTTDGYPGCAAPEPNKGADQLYGRYSVTFKADSLPGYKVAFLLWPGSDNWSDGEIDFPEADLNGTIDGYSHCVGNPSSNCGAFTTNTSLSSFHTAVIEWTPGKVTFALDGKTLGTTTKSVMSVPAHFVLQTETSTGGVVPAASMSGAVYVDEVEAWSYSAN